MTKDELITRLKGYEWTDFECKKAYRDVPKDAYSTVSAFANTQGGWLLFGVSEKAGELDVAGVDPKAFDRVQNDFLSTLRGGQKLNHIISAEPHVYELEGKRILAFYIPELPRHQKPVYLKSDPRETYLRRAASDERVTDAELQRFLRDNAMRPWDAEAIADMDVPRCFDEETISWYRQQFYRRDPEQRQIDDAVAFLREWNFIVEQDGSMLPTRAGVLLFGTDHAVRQLLPRPVLDYQRIDTRFENWSSDDRWHDRLIFEENIFKTWRGLVAKYMRLADHPFSLDPATLRRNDDPPDYVSFREAAINLLIHQDYGDPYRKAAIKFFTDRTIFWNPGDAFYTESELLDPTEKEVRNPSIVKAFRRIGMSDQAGSGIRAIFRNWRDLGHVPPEIRNDKSRKSFEIVLLKQPLITEKQRTFLQTIGVSLNADEADVFAFVAEKGSVDLTDIRALTNATTAKAKALAESLVKKLMLVAISENAFELAPSMKMHYGHDGMNVPGVQTTPEVAPEAAPEVSPEVRRMLSVLIGERSRAELMAALSLKDEKHFREYYQQAAISVGLIEMTIPDKPRSSKQKYRLTAMGKAILENQ
ncbi:MAG: transcriptional regulator [Pelodictyon luteolum]|uniref:Transcriptional regulator n=1 Tax=Pelodictyon luteolum TaxID=1100 RepID=A0A165LSD9_PELLU|nr:RNA-binding domain-containing protein [Pelodictyon luteolum]KZK74370.1 MAG: transcriptional regulator [Pelodictyon luteolum]